MRRSLRQPRDRLAASGRLSKLELLDLAGTRLRHCFHEQHTSWRLEVREALTAERDDLCLRRCWHAWLQFDERTGNLAPLVVGLSHRFAQNGLADEFAFKIWSPFLETLDHEVVEIWQRGDWKTFCGMLPEYASKGHGEGFMHDTAMLLGVLGWSDYEGRAEVVTPYFGSSGTGQINAIFPITPQDGRAVPKPVASSAQGYASVATRL